MEFDARIFEIGAYFGDENMVLVLWIEMDVMSNVVFYGIVVVFDTAFF